MRWFPVAGAVACQYAEEKASPHRRKLRGMGLCRPLPHAGTPTRSAAPHHDLREEVFNALRWIVRAGASWRCFTTISHRGRPSTSRDAKVTGGRRPDAQPTAAVLDSRTLRSTPESGQRSGYDGAKPKKGSKVHAAVSTLWDTCSPGASRRPPSRTGRRWRSWHGRCRRRTWARAWNLGVCGPGLHGEDASVEAQAQGGIRLEVAKHPGAKKGFVLLPRRWVVERSLAWAFRFRRLWPKTTSGCPGR